MNDKNRPGPNHPQPPSPVSDQDIEDVDKGVFIDEK